MSVEIIAEVASNHGGSMDVAKRFIDTFAKAGASTIKFQLTRVKHLDPNDAQYAWFKKAELRTEQFSELKQHTEEQGANFLLTCYNAADVQELVELRCQRVKIGSGEAENEALATATIGADLQRVVSLGIGRHRFSTWTTLWPGGSFLACISRYPVPSGLAAVYLSGQPSIYSGWSDHCIGINDCCAAIILGASIIECHVKIPHQKRPSASWEKSAQDIQQLRRFAEFDPEARFTQRWQFA